jgi:chorismate mutase
MRLNRSLPLRLRISEMRMRRTRKENTPAKQLNRWRREIDDLDEVILEALELRARSVREIGRYKKGHGLPVLDAARERLILDRVVEKDGLLPTRVRGEIFATIIQRMREWESTLE